MPSSLNSAPKKQKGSKGQWPLAGSGAEPWEKTGSGAEPREKTGSGAEPWEKTGSGAEPWEKNKIPGRATRGRLSIKDIS